MARNLQAILARVTLDNSDFLKKMKEIQTLSNSFKTIGDKLTKSITLPTAALAGTSLRAYAQFDSLRKALDTVEGSAQNTSRRIKELAVLAKLPGLGFQEAIQGDVRLRSVGFTAERSAKALKEFANAVALTGGGKAELSRITVQLGQLSAKGKVLAQDLKPIIEAAPIVGRALSEMFGTVDSESIQAQLEAAGKNSTQFIDDLVSKLSEMPRVTGGFKTSVENIQDALFQFGSSIGQSIDQTFNLTGRLEDLSNKIVDVADRINEATPAQKQFAVTSVGVVAAVGPAISIIARLTEFLPGLALNWNKATTGLLRFVKGAGGLARLNFIVLGIALVIDNLEPIGGLLADIGRGFRNLYETNRSFRTGIDLVVEGLKFLGKAFDGAFIIASSILKSIIIITKQVLIFGDALLRLALLDLSGFKNIGEKLRGAFDEGFKGILKDFVDFDKKLQPTPARINRGGGLDFSRLSIRPPKATGGGGGKAEESDLTKLQKELKALETLVASGFLPVVDLVGSKLDAIEKAAKNMASKGLTPANKEFKELINLAKQISGADTRGFLKIPELPSIDLRGVEIVGVDILAQNIEKALGVIPKSFQKIRDEFRNSGQFVNPNIKPAIVKFEQVQKQIGEVQDKIGNISNFVGPAITGLSDLSNAYFDSKIAKIDEAHDRERRLIESTIGDEKLKAAAIAKLEETTESKKRAIRRREAIANKALAIFNIALSTAQAIANALTIAPPAGIILAAVVGALGIAQAGIAASRPIPALAKGGLLHGPSLVYAGEYQGAGSNPEVIAPLKTLKKYFNTGAQELYAVIKAGDIYLSNKVGAQHNTRYA